MRQYTNLAKKDPEILRSFSILTDKKSSSQIYSEAFFKLGGKLAELINLKINSSDQVVFSCATEDADWLGRGILDNLSVKKFNLAIFWNLRTRPFNDDNLVVAPIIKSYIEDIKSCDTLIICKSIIYTSCVIRTNLTYLINQINPTKIIIVSPVIFRSAEISLAQEFEDSISSKFEFIYFAIDDEVTSQGEVVPGIGGNLYTRLGFSGVENKNKYIPELVKHRRNLQYE